MAATQGNSFNVRKNGKILF